VVQRNPFISLEEPLGSAKPPLKITAIPVVTTLQLCCRSRGVGGDQMPLPKIYLGVKHGILNPQIFGKKYFLGGIAY